MSTQDVGKYFNSTSLDEQLLQVPIGSQPFVAGCGSLSRPPQHFLFEGLPLVADLC